MPPHRCDVLVIGRGPAGLAAAAACAEAGLLTLSVDPSPAPAWPNTYGVWVDEAPVPAWCLGSTWSTALAYSDQGGRRALDRSYGRIDNDALARWLHGRAEAAGATWRTGQVVALQAGPRGAIAPLADGGELVANVVVDCGGDSTRFLQPGQVSTSPVAWQTAHGVLAEVEGHPWAPGEMVLMDYRTVPAVTAPGPPSFLYAMPHDARTVFLEETVLAATPAVPTERLQRRLDRRLDALGIRVTATHAVEQVRIPMDAPLPRIPQPVVGFGAAAGFVHPATGYSLVRSLQQSPALARALVEGLGRGGPEEAARRAWHAIHPTTLRRSRRLARGGLRVLLDLDGRDLGAFMHHFFDMPATHWQAFLSGTAPSAALARAMFRLGLHLPSDLLLHVARVASGHGRTDLLRGLLPGLERHAS